MNLLFRKIRDSLIRMNVNVFYCDGLGISVGNEMYYSQLESKVKVLLVSKIHFLYNTEELGFNVTKDQINCVALRLVYDKSEEKIFQDKIQACRHIP
jgi:hypothetical protein